MKREPEDHADSTLRQRKPTSDATATSASSMSTASQSNDFRRPRGKSDEPFSADSTDESDAEERRRELLKKKQQQPQLTTRQKFWKRFYSTWTMIFTFFLIIYIGHTALCLLVVLFQAAGFREIAALGSKPRIEKQLPGFYLLHWHFFLTSIFFLYGQLLTEHLLIGIFPSHKNLFLEFILRHHGFITFMLIVVGVISFVLSLKKGFYKYQFKQLGWCMAIIIIVVVQSTFVMKNIMDGIIWFFVPASAIITNDIMAYMCGRTFGKKFIKAPLIGLSPNKTWEGAIGACFWTILFTWAFAAFLIDYDFFICPKKGFGFAYPTCERDEIFISRPYEVPFMSGKIVDIAPFQFHSLIFSLYASLIGPFGGFFASGFKRAFKLKDFSQSVGYGHGGILDRMDCQIMMCVFVYVYRQSFVVNIAAQNVMSLPQITQNILRLSQEDKLKLLDSLKSMVEPK